MYLIKKAPLIVMKNSNFLGHFGMAISLQTSQQEWKIASRKAKNVFFVRDAYALCSAQYQAFVLISEAVMMV